MGGASGGFTTARQEIIDLLRQRSRPYLFSNSLPPALVASAIRAFELLWEPSPMLKTLVDNTKYFREKISEAGFDIVPGTHPIVPVMLVDAGLSQKLANGVLKEGIYVIGFFYPVVPKGKARIRVQISAAHSREHLDKAIGAFSKVGKELGII